MTSSFRVTAMMACFGALPFALSLCEKARRDGSFRAALRPAIYSTSRRVLRPPPMRRFPVRTPLSRAIGASPARAATWRGVRAPSSGISAIRAVAETGPTPGAVRRRAARLRRSFEDAMSLAMVASICATSRCNSRRTRATEARVLFSHVWFRRIFSRFASSTNWRRRSCNALRRLTSFGSGGHSGRSSRIAISRITPASTRSVFASRPSEVAKARARRGLIRIAGTSALPSAVRSGVSYPPDASNATRPPCFATRRAKAPRSLVRTLSWPSGPTTSTQFFATSTPNTISIMIPLFQSHGIGCNRPNQVCRTNHCGRGSGPETMSSHLDIYELPPAATFAHQRRTGYFDQMKGDILFIWSQVSRSVRQSLTARVPNAN